MGFARRALRLEHPAQHQLASSVREQAISAPKHGALHETEHQFATARLRAATEQPGPGYMAHELARTPWGQLLCRYKDATAAFDSLVHRHPPRDLQPRMPGTMAQASYWASTPNQLVGRHEYRGQGQRLPLKRGIPPPINLTLDLLQLISPAW